jgi:hypothetical protein
VRQALLTIRRCNLPETPHRRGGLSSRGRWRTASLLPVFIQPIACGATHLQGRRRLLNVAWLPLGSCLRAEARLRSPRLQPAMLESPRPGVHLELDLHVTSAASLGLVPPRPEPVRRLPDVAEECPASARAASTDRSRRLLPSPPRTLHASSVHAASTEVDAALPSAARRPLKTTTFSDRSRLQRMSCAGRPTHPRPSPLARLQPPTCQPP